MEWPKGWHAGKAWHGGGGYGGTPWVLTPTDLLRLYKVIPRRDERRDARLVASDICSALGVASLTEARAGRALQILRKASFIEFHGPEGGLRWQRTQA